MELSLHYGYQNTAKSGRYLPVTVEIGNHTETAFSGKLELSIPEPGGDLVHYRYDAAAEAGQSVSVRAMISVTDAADRLVMRLLAADGSIVAEQEEALSIQGNAEELLIGVLSSTPQELSYFRGLGISETQLRTRTVSLNPADLPETAEGLSQIDVILISNYDMNRLSGDNVRVLWDWVGDGGALLLGTGDAREPLGGLSEYLDGVELGLPETQTVNMGMQYAADSPDSAVLNLSVRSIYAPEGLQALQSGELAVLTTLSEGSGVIGLAAYDLCDIREFCSREIGYPDELLKALLGKARLQKLSARSADSARSYAELEALVNVPDPERYPNLSIYFVIAAAYMLLAGPGIYMLLRKNGLGIYYSFSVILLSVSAAALLWFAGMRTRFEGPLVEYASVYERSGDQVNETELLNVSTPLGSALSLSVSPEYLVQPVLPGRNSGLTGRTAAQPGEGASAAFAGQNAAENGNQTDNGNETGDAGSADGSSAAARRAAGKQPGAGSRTSQAELVIESGEESQTIGAKRLRPFETRLFELYRSGDSTEGDGVPEAAVELSYFDGTLSGSVRNESEEELEDVTLLMHGRIISVGTLAPGQMKDLSGYSAVFGPTGSGRLTAEYITEAGALSPEQPEYAAALARTRLLSRYLQESLSNYYSGARLIAFRTQENGPAAVLNEAVESYGTSLYAQTVPVDLRQGEEVYRSALSNEPKVISGAYEAGSNTAGGAAPVVLEYALGSDLFVTSLRLNGLSEEFSGGITDDGQKLLPFRGIRAFYNYQTGAYDTLGSAQDHFDAEEIAPYLSPSNTVTVRYIPDENMESGSLMFLPVPTVTGIEK